MTLNLFCHLVPSTAIIGVSHHTIGRISGDSVFHCCWVFLFVCILILFFIFLLFIYLLHVKLFLAHLELISKDPGPTKLQFSHLLFNLATFLTFLYPSLFSFMFGNFGESHSGHGKSGSL